MAASVAVSVVAGLVLGFLAAVQVWFGESHWTETVQAHGQLQLVGWVGVFVAALSFEFIIRLNQRPPLPVLPRVLVLLGLASGALVGAAGQVWHAQAGLLWPTGAALSLAASTGFAVLVFRVKAPRPLRSDPQPLFFRVASFWLVIATSLHLLSVLRADGPVIPLAESRLVAEILIRGFVLNTIVAVALRAFPGHLDLRPMPARKQAVVLAIVNVSVAVWAATSGAFGLSASAGTQQVADLAFAGVLLALSWWLGVLSPLRHPRRGPNYRVLLPLAWSGLVIYAITLAAAAIDPRMNDLSLYQQGGVRHIFMLGFMAPLMVAMAHIVLARFGTGRVKWEPLLTTAFVILMVAWPLRVAPVLVVESPGEIGRTVLGVAAALTALALAAFLLVAAANAREIRRADRAQRSRTAG